MQIDVFRTFLVRSPVKLLTFRCWLTVRAVAGVRVLPKIKAFDTPVHRVSRAHGFRLILPHTALVQPTGAARPEQRIPEKRERDDGRNNSSDRVPHHHRGRRKYWYRGGVQCQRHRGNLCCVLESESGFNEICIFISRQHLIFSPARSSYSHHAEGHCSCTL